MTQYSNRIVIIHWLTLALLLLAWYLGSNLADSTDASKATLSGYFLHISVGAAILLLTLFRFYSRRRDGVPPPADKAPWDKVAKAVHYALYTLLVLLPASGLTILLTSKAGPALWAGDASLLPKEHGYRGVFAQVVHEQLVTVLIVLASLHILAALAHQFFLKDRLISRMSLPKKD